MGKLTGGDPSLLRKINSAAVLRALRSADTPPTLTDLAGVTGLSRPTVEGVIEGLAEAGLAAEAAGGSGARRMGRPARRFRFRAEAGHALGVEIGAHRASVVLADLAGGRLGTAAREVSETASAEERLAAAVGAVADVLAAAGVSRGSLRVAGVGTPG
ncbi:helix-turn-helix domain-containing protein, partial [Streptomyces otsuchiensis]|uniref:helix-turn-helix domain-containing protein n=1 Tax=Streptomyces otsuchiensis TaxID=2681388 RepID=UPI0013007E7B